MMIKKTSFALFILLVMFTTSAYAATERIQGNDRYQTAVEISKAGWEVSDIVVLAKGTDFPDALAGGPLAFYHDAPILLTDSDRLPYVTEKEINRLQTKTIIIIGSESAVSSKISNRLIDLGLTVQRVGGRDRFETAALISQLIPSNQAIISNGRNYPDVLSIGSYAARNNIPILLTEKDRLPIHTEKALQDKINTLVIGGEKVVGKAVVSQLAKHNPVRIGGTDRYDTGRKIMNELQLSNEMAYLATGENFADALAGSVLAARTNAPILLTKTSVIPTPTRALLPEFNEIKILGGQGAVHENVRRTIDGEPLILDNPKVNTITDNMFKISGSATANTKLIVRRNNKDFNVVNVPANGKFSISIPLQKSGAMFSFFILDGEGNKSETVNVQVKAQSNPSKKMLYAPLVKQMPELPRGCEVTSLSMLLQYTGVKADKMKLAREVRKSPTPLRWINGKKHFGDPNEGFVGDMYSFSKPGFGVFNKPIEELANKYLPGRVVNLSGGSFDQVLDYVAAGHPVWVITTSWFSHVPDRYWETWYTPNGPIRITMKEHSVLITGYDSQYVYFNDPLDTYINKRKPLKSFIQGWEQYGKQAISYY
ncbi:cell wall-binding repeat-containing protein [Mesobacillus selenatarsenatis]|nr:cell wall-binding repeat-containing protein [Mesobacillus selenatarsenatis]